MNSGERASRGLLTEVEFSVSPVTVLGPESNSLVAAAMVNESKKKKNGFR